MYESKIRQIADHYGLKAQLVQTAEESSELAHAALKYLRRDCRDNLIEEMADVLIMTEQLCYLPDCEQDVKDAVIEKLDRQIKRIGEECGNEITL